MPRLPLILAATLGLAAMFGLAPAAHAEMVDHSGHNMTGAESPATKAYMEANMKMHAEMNVPFTGNPDVDFMAGMIPHHQGAVDMARIVLEHGTDPEVRAFAETIIAAQEAEIAFMKEWLARQ